VEESSFGILPLKVVSVVSIQYAEQGAFSFHCCANATVEKEIKRKKVDIIIIPYIFK
jgi:hypothetical protein